MKIVLIQPDGMADEPLQELQNRTPVEHAYTPNLDHLANIGLLGTVHTIPEGFPPGSDIGNLVLTGHNPNEVFTGRAPLEAAASGIETTPEDVVYRVNFVTILDGQMVDFTAGHISDEEGAELVRCMNEKAPDGLTYFPGVSYRNLAVWRNGKTPTQAEPPHNLTGSSVAGFSAEPAEIQTEMQRVRDILANHPINAQRIKSGKHPATDIWMWGEGRTPVLRSLDDMYAQNGVMITAVDLLRGIARLSGMEVRDVVGATGFIDTNYEGKCQAALDSLDTHGLVFVHIEAPDESAHMGRTDYKVKSIEDIDSYIIGPLMRAARNREDVCIVILPDHPTLIRTKTHASTPVPCVVAYPEMLSRTASNSRTYSETAVVDFELQNGWELLRRVWRRELGEVT